MEELKDEKIEKLLNEFNEQRDKLKEMVSSLETLKNKIDKLFPESIEARFLRFFEEKVKSATALFSAILEVRKEIIKTLKEEVELRNKYQRKEEADGDFSEEEIRSLAGQIEKFSKKKDSIEKRLEETNLQEKEIAHG